MVKLLLLLLLFLVFHNPSLSLSLPTCMCRNPAPACPFHAACREMGSVSRYPENLTWSYAPTCSPTMIFIPFQDTYVWLDPVVLSLVRHILPTAFARIPPHLRTNKDFRVICPNYVGICQCNIPSFSLPFHLIVQDTSLVLMHDGRHGVVGPTVTPSTIVDSRPSLACKANGRKMNPSIFHSLFVHQVQSMLSIWRAKPHECLTQPTPCCLRRKRN